MIAARPVTFAAEATGRVQLARTGSGFWHPDSPEPFSIDAALLERMVRNTKLRARPLRVDFMHYANGSSKVMPISALAEAGEIEPSALSVEPWLEPNTKTMGLGVFAPNAWTDESRAAVGKGIKEISPVIDWNYKLPEDVTDPETGEIIAAGTRVGPCIIGVSLVDRGFFWMDKVQLYAEGTPSKRPSLYQELKTMMTFEDAQAKAKTFVEACGGDAEKIDTIAGMLLADAQGAAPEAEAAPIPDMMGEPAPAVLAARAPASVTLAALVQRGKKAAPAAKKLDVGQYGEKILSLEDRLAAVESRQDDLMIDDLERQGLTVGMDDPKRLYREAPQYFLEAVAKRQPLVKPSPAPAAKPSPLRAVAKTAGQSEEDRFAVGVKLYRETQAKAGRKIDEVQAIEEYEASLTA